MKHKGTVALETDRLILRKFKLEDSEAAFQNWTNDDRVTEFLRWPPHENIEVTKKIISLWIDHYTEDTFYHWAIVEKENGDKPIGTISVVHQKEELNILGIGYCIGSQWWNKGITSEALSAILPFLFEEVEANRIESRHDLENPNSGKVMIKCGLQYEGTLREADVNNRGVVDAAMYSILAREYFESKHDNV